MTRLTERLRSATASLHQQVERGPFISTLLKGRMERPAYLGLLLNLEPIYAALEPALERHARDPALRALPLPALARTAALREDIAALGGDGALDGSRSAAPSAPEPACLEYVTRLGAIAQARPELLLAHAYVRYLGDLSGGQLLRRIVTRSLALEPDRGVAFYDFGADSSALARELRLAIDEGQVSDGDAVVAEACLAFELHRRLFEELATTFGCADGGTPFAPPSNGAAELDAID